jgi:hypothetical protein
LRSPLYSPLDGKYGSSGPAFVYFSVNISGPEFPTARPNYAFPVAADWTYLRSKGFKTVRLPVAWERLQPTLLGALDTTYVNLIKAFIADAAAQGMDVIVDLHNFARWDSSFASAGYPGQTGFILGSGSLTQAMLVDVWQKLATTLTGLSGLAGYCIMNEPHTMESAATNKVVRPNYFAAESGSSWFAQNGAVLTKLAAGTNPLGAGYGPAWSMTSGTGFGANAYAFTFTAVPYVLSFYAKCSAATVPFNLTIQGTQSPGKTATTTWQRFEFSRTPAAGAADFNIIIAAGAGNTIQIANAQLELGATATAYAPNPWKAFAQATVTAVRAIDASTPIYICGYQFSSAKDWQKVNYEMGLTGTGLRYEAHQYFDANGSGVYSGTYASNGATPTTGSDSIIDFGAWLTLNGYTGYLGEFGVPNDDPQWITLLNNFLSAAKTAGIPGAEWFYGAFSAQDSGRLNIAKSANGGNDAPQIAPLISYPA